MQLRASQKDPRGREGGRKRAHLAETPAAVRVTHIRGDSITVTVAGKALGEAVVARGTAVTLAATDPRLATTKRSDTRSQEPQQPTVHTAAGWCVITHLHCPVRRSQSGLAVSLIPVGEHSQPSQPSRG